ncbi:MAG: OsmC family protein [Candidatus Tectomicrobia bacterium]|nr:OsmC family protein [Candidatus Tectomicrobia bacterium]
MLRLNLKAARARVSARFHGEGSVRAETVLTHCTGVETTLELESEDDPAQLAKLARVAEAGCYVIQSLRHPTEVAYKVSLNGTPLSL